MKHKILITVLFVLSYAAYALQWPVDIEYMTSSFLEERSGTVQSGLVFEGYDSMRPYDYGETIFRYVPEAYGALPGEGDSMLVLEHENGFQSIYSGISPSEARQDRNRLSAGEYLKAPSEDNEFSTCYFYIRDAHLNQLVNPMILLPVPDDSVIPLIKSVILMDGDRSFELMGGMKDRSMPVGNYEVFVKAVDMTNRAVIQMPYSYALYNLGSLLLERELDALVLKDAQRVFKDGKTLDSVFSMPSYLSLGEIILTSGQALLEISVTDIHGNEGSRSFQLQVFR
ncbi:MULTISPECIES: hypothetical protein [unclassified Oceanispirochaeta]|uniref:hypothetical protein n=1 Tax=unclassified Oceanispirochaeta TaxID=2635722 RepID=UPI000E09969F|nr:MULTISPECIES: hypothetical protein [unclassified Oceanispirochaeta]MBF9016127.1 hypothetical protein [Oceanispirochaeta sp. M2]NPD72589.1 hypothetical protein [Oceanispirochaeta sp. M1]RDG31741.1 hypothetical protein DV872_10815 [Oceanispirochaeta sp. M1]